MSKSPDMLALLKKICNGIAHIFHGNMKKEYRYFISDNYLSRFLQLRFLVQDRIVKRRYKVIEYYGEFQQELCFVLPFAYWHFKNGTLKKTISCKYTKELYFFSPQHEEKHESRAPEFNRENFSIPNMSHTLGLDQSRWLQVPLKQQYTNNIFRFDKPLLIIANKYNGEWGGRPVNYLSLETLAQIFEYCSNSYQIIYNRPASGSIVGDNSDILHLGDDDLLKAYPQVISMNKLYYESRNIVNTFNHLQLMVYANCERFISVHGGTATLASYFGGTNIILSKFGVEHAFGEFENIFSKLSGANIIHCTDNERILPSLQRYF